jgi:CRISP-associated protein Cas1
MHPLYLVEQGAQVRIEQRRMVLARKDEVIMKVPMAHVASLILFGNISLTTPTIKRLLRDNTDTIFLSIGGDYQGRLVGRATPHSLLRRQQYERLQQEAFALPLSQQMIYGKIHNMRTFLRRYKQRGVGPEMRDILTKLDEACQRTFRTTKLNSLRGVEGSATALYFRVLRQVFKHDWGFHNRNRRPPLDPVNVLLSFGYTLLAREVEASVYIVGLDPYMGAFHTIDYGRPSLALDVMEEFRTILVDSITLRCLNNEIITQDDFTQTNDTQRPIRLSDDGMRRFIREWENRLQTEITHPVTHERMVYRRVFETQLRMLARALRDNNPQIYRPFIVR